MSMTDFEKEIQTLIDEASTEVAKLEEDVRISNSKLASAQASIMAYRTTLQAHRDRRGIRGEEDIQGMFQGLTQPKALVVLAEQNAGTVRVRDAADVLVRAGKISKPKNAYSN